MEKLTFGNIIDNLLKQHSIEEVAHMFGTSIKRVNYIALGFLPTKKNVHT